jgi:hypothetical protein
VETIDKDPGTYTIRCTLEGCLKKVVKPADVYGFIPFLLKGFRCKEGRDYTLRIIED